MADTKAAAKTAAAKAPAPELLRAAESGEPDVHRLVALRQSAVQVENKAEVKRIDDALAALGYRV